MTYEELRLRVRSRVKHKASAVLIQQIDYGSRVGVAIRLGKRRFGLRIAWSIAGTPFRRRRVAMWLYREICRGIARGPGHAWHVLAPRRRKGRP